MAKQTKSRPWTPSESQAVVKSYVEYHNRHGVHSDDIAQQERHKAGFYNAVKGEVGPDRSKEDVCKKLIGLRKAGKLPAVTR